MTGPDPLDNRRQVLYWRLLARLFDHEEQVTLESASLAVVTDIGLPAALLDPQVSVDSIVQRHPELEVEFDGLMVPAPDTGGARDKAAEVRRAALASKVLLNVFATGGGAVTAGQLARWQSDAGWLERAFGGRPGEPEDAFAATLDQSLFLKNGAVVRGLIAAKPGSLVDRLAKRTDPDAVADELFVSVLTRPPTDDERRDVAAALKDVKDRPAALAELVWALVASAEFRFNH